MRYLLDTHAFLWWLDDDRRLAASARGVIAAPSNEIFVSAASIWEIAIKTAVGKLKMRGDHARRLADLVSACGFAELMVSARHAAGVRDLPFHHTDPFDRLLIAQARAETLTMLSVDPEMSRYGIDVLPASR